MSSLRRPSTSSPGSPRRSRSRRAASGRPVGGRPRTAARTRTWSTNSFSSILHERPSAIDASTAAAWTAPGICAHESAMRGGASVNVPDFSELGDLTDVTDVTDVTGVNEVGG